MNDDHSVTPFWPVAGAAAAYAVGYESASQCSR